MHKYETTGDSVFIALAFFHTVYNNQQAYFDIWIFYTKGLMIPKNFPSSFMLS